MVAPSALAWTEFDSGDLEICQAETVGDGRVVARAHSGTGTEIVVTENGADWTGVNVPEGVAVNFIDLSSPRWLIGQASGSNPAGVFFYSDDEGRNWTETSIDQINYPAACDAGLLSTNRDGRWVVESYDGAIRVKSLGRLDDHETATATMRDVADLTSFATSPAGMVAAA